MNYNRHRNKNNVFLRAAAAGGSFEKYQGGNWRQRRQQQPQEPQRERQRQAEPEQRKIEKRPTLERPPTTETSFDELGPKSIPLKPKILVLGATGRTGRHVIRQLLSSNIDMTVVAYVRDYDKAIRVFYDDVLFVPINRNNKGENSNNNNSDKMNPKLQIVVGDLVPLEELGILSEETIEDEQIWKNSAESASSFYETNMEEYDNRELLPNVNESLEDAIKDCTAIISCVGSTRPTNIWQDYCARPFIRLLKVDVSGWCKDPRHPYYVHYFATRKVLGYAEKEQLRREAAVATIAEEEEEEEEQRDTNNKNKDSKNKMTSTPRVVVPKIRFVRVSDLSVVYDPWHIVPFVANVVHSLVFRYHDLSERLLQDSTIIETVIIRPGDLIDDERDTVTTHVQVSSNGRVSSPSIIGREDVASLCVAAATFTKQNKTTVDISSSNTNRIEEEELPFHYTFGARWVGPTIESYPDQGSKQDGYRDPALAFKRSLKQIYRRERDTERKERIERSLNNINNNSNNNNNQQQQRQTNTNSGGDNNIVIRMAQRISRKRRRHRLSLFFRSSSTTNNTKPYGIVVAVPVYFFLGLFCKIILIPTLRYVPGGQQYILPSLNRLYDLLRFGFVSLLRLLQQSFWPWIVSLLRRRNKLMI